MYFILKFQHSTQTLTHTHTHTHFLYENCKKQQQQQQQHENKKPLHFFIVKNLWKIIIKIKKVFIWWKSPDVLLFFLYALKFMGAGK